mgnify:CR=1 FL=1
MSLNRVILTGRLTRDPEFKASQSGVGVAKLSMAVDSFYKGEKKTSFVDLTAFGKNAELLRDYFKKGYPIGIDGALHQENWEKDGEKRTKIVVYIDRIEFMGGKKEDSENNEIPGKKPTKNKPQADFQEESDFDPSGEMPF